MYILKTTIEYSFQLTAFVSTPVKSAAPGVKETEVTFKSPSHGAIDPVSK